MRAAITGLLALHGAIHVLGFLKWSGLAPLPQLGGRTLLPLSASSARVFAALWLFACLALVAAAVLRIARNDAWWTTALFGVLTSQALIVIAWSDAKVGTVANLILFAHLLVAAAQTRFEHATDALVEGVLARVDAKPTTVVTRAELASLPTPVSRWLERSGVVGRPRARSARLRQRGQMRTAPDATWMAVDAEQYFRIEDPAFVWRVHTTMFGVVPIAGRDTYGDGAGRMLIEAAGLIAVVDQADARIAHGAMLRFLAEIMWFPSAALSPYLRWEPVDTERAKVTMRHAGLEASAVFRFDALARVTGVEAQRYLGGGKDARLTPWSGTCAVWRTFDGVEVPTEGDVRWSLPEGPFSYYRWTITELEQDRPELYREPKGKMRELARAGDRPIALPHAGEGP